MPIFLREYGPAVAFGIPGVLMFIATVIFWAGRKKYAHIPPSKPDPDSFMSVVRTVLRGGSEGAGAGSMVAVAGLVLAVAISACGHSRRLWPQEFGFVSSPALRSARPAVCGTARRCNANARAACIQMGGRRVRSVLPS